MSDVQNIASNADNLIRIIQNIKEQVGGQQSASSPHILTAIVEAGTLPSSTTEQQIQKQNQKPRSMVSANMVASQEEQAHRVAQKPMNEDIDFYNKLSRSEGSSGDDDDDENEQHSQPLSAREAEAAAAKKGTSIDPDLADDSGQFEAAQFDVYKDDEEEESLGEMMMNANLKKSSQDNAWW